MTQEGIAVDFLLVWCGRSATTLVAAGHISNSFWGRNELLTSVNCDSSATAKQSNHLQTNDQFYSPTTYIVWLATLFRAIGPHGDTDGSLKAVNSASYDSRRTGRNELVSENVVPMTSCWHMCKYAQ
ncbi:hypothetical protein [Shewanella frigidimarina]|uniref:hypothetical protein n=1 Tax=Shewanella frigidimarina TaxID=56812 RepID=UPI003D7A9181